MRPLGDPGALDYAGLLVLALCWGSSFFFIEIALDAFGPLSISAARIGIAAIFLGALAVLRGHHVPKRGRDLGLLLLAAVSGTAIPFSLIPWAQEELPSSTSAILMAFTPLVGVALAQVMTPDERITPAKLLALGLGTFGVALLVAGGGDIRFEGGPLRHGALLLGATGYAFSSLILRRTSNLPTLVSSAGVMVASTLVILPVALIFERPLEASPDWHQLGALLFLGIFPSSVAVIVLIALLGRVGVTFVMLNNYLVPAVGVLLGVGFLGEVLRPATLGGFGLVLAGVLMLQLANHRRRARERKAT